MVAGRKVRLPNLLYFPQSLCIFRVCLYVSALLFITINSDRLKNVETRRLANEQQSGLHILANHTSHFWNSGLRHGLVRSIATGTLTGMFVNIGV
jgi:hypothetical protein